MSSSSNVCFYLRQSHCSINISVSFIIIYIHIAISGLPWYRMVKNLPAMQETQVQSLGWEDPLEKGMAIHSSVLAQRIPWTEEPGELQSMGSQRVRQD